MHEEIIVMGQIVLTFSIHLLHRGHIGQYIGCVFFLPTTLQSNLREHAEMEYGNLSEGFTVYIGPHCRAFLD